MYGGTFAFNRPCWRAGTGVRIQTESDENKPSRRRVARLEWHTILWVKFYSIKAFIFLIEIEEL